jgi:hypothetical protein
VKECYQLHEFENVLQELRVTKREILMSLFNASKKMKTENLIINSEIKVIQVSIIKVTQVFIATSTSVSISVHTQIFAQILTSILDQISNLKRRIIKDESSNFKISVKKTRNEDKKKNDINIIFMLSFEDEKKSKSKSQKLKDIRLVCEFLYEIVRNQEKILVDLDQQYKRLMRAKKYGILKKKCQEISESTSSMIQCFLSFYSDERKMFKIIKDPKIKDQKIIGSEKS